MYARILVPLEHSPADETILAHVRGLAKRLGSAVVLIHVADGWVARNIKELELRESRKCAKPRLPGGSHAPGSRPRAWTRCRPRRR